MEEKLKYLHLVMNGVTVNGPMFDIHDNGVVNYTINHAKETALHTSEEGERRTILALLEATDEAGNRIFAEKAQWYAVFKVLSECRGYPKVMREFCDIMRNWGMHEVSPACDYESMRKVPNTVAFPTQKVALWHNYKDKAEGKLKKQITVAMKLMELLSD